MIPQSVHVDRGSGPAGDADVCELVRSLVRSIAGDTPSPLDQTQELVLDIEVDGVRYLLIRQMCQTPRIQSILSPRELEIARMVAKGYPNKIIAGVLDISSWTVCTHLRRIFAKLGVSSRAAMVARIVEEGVILPRNANH
jgi:DNA-binding NarL/FixJ family response regulator